MKLAETTKALADRIANPAERFSLEHPWDVCESRVVCVGDWHVGYSVKNECLRLMPYWRKLGFTHVAFELLSVDMQPVVGEYFDLWQGNGGDSTRAAEIRTTLFEQFCSVWCDGPIENESETTELGMVATKFTQMITEMVRNGLRPVAIELPLPRLFSDLHGLSFIHTMMEKMPSDCQSTFDDFWVPPVQSDEFESASDSLESLLVSKHIGSPTDVIRFVDYLRRIRAAKTATSLKSLNLPLPADTVNGQLDEPFQNIIGTWRDQTWLDAVESVLKQAQNRMIAFAGFGHFGYKMPSWPNPDKQQSLFNEMLSDRGFETSVIGFTGGDFPISLFRNSTETFGCPVPFASEFLEASTLAGLSETAFAVQMGTDTPRSCDWMIHLPRTAELE